MVHRAAVQGAFGGVEKARALRTGLVLEGGAMRAGFVAGVLMAWLDLGLPLPDLATGVSASAATLAYFAAGQRDDMEAVWRGELCDPELVCFQNLPACALTANPDRPALDVGRLVFDVFARRHPLNQWGVSENPMESRFAAARVGERRLHLFRPGEADLYDILHACMCVPACYPRTVRIGGGEYLDAGVVDPLPARTVWRMLGHPERRIVAVLSRPVGWRDDMLPWYERVVFWRYFKANGWMVRSLRRAGLRYRAQVNRLEDLARLDPPRALVLRPPGPPPVRFVTLNQERLNRLIDEGYREVIRRRDEIERFLQGSPVGSVRGVSSGGTPPN
ncbi:patatin-like phospholipase family protein [Deferrisoma sp.]